MGSLLTRYLLFSGDYTATAVKLGTSEGSYKLGHCGLHRCQWGVYSPDTLYDFGIIRRQPSSLWLPKEVTSLGTADYIDANGEFTHQIHFMTLALYGDSRQAWALRNAFTPRESLLTICTLWF